MSRHREFNEPEALEGAMMTFWQKGFDDTSYDDLVEATGVSRYGLYTAFGDKKEFFLHALDYYLDQHRGEMLGPLHAKGASLPAIRAHFSRVLDKVDDPEQKVGCMLCNTAIELARFDKAAEDRVHEMFAEIKAAFKKAAKNAIEKGELSGDPSANQVADYLFGLMMGGALLMRSPIERSKIRNFIKTGLAGLK